MKTIEKHGREKYDHKVICDVCGKQFRRSQVTQIDNPFNLLHKLIVCQADVEKTNAQNYPDFNWKESIVDPRLVRPESEDTYVMITTVDEIENGDVNDFGGQVASAPLNIRLIEVTANVIDIAWMPPVFSGSRGLIGWTISRESPVGGGFSTIVTNTNSVEMSYRDTGLNTNTVYNYKVAAVTRAGTGAYSDTFAVRTE